MIRRQEELPMKQPKALFCAVLSTLLILSLPTFAQDFRGSILGIVTDESVAVLPGVTVTITNVETNLAQPVVTDARGAYQVRYLNSGTYSVEAQLDGFKTVVRKGIAVRVGDALTLDLTMQPGGVEEVITVTASAPLLDTNSGV